MASEARLPYEARLRDVLSAYQDAQSTIMAQIKAAAAAGDLDQKVRRIQALQAVLNTLDRLGVRTDPMARLLVADAFRESADRTGTRAKGAGIDTTVNLSTFNQIEIEAVQALQDSILGALRDARALVGRRVADDLARVGRRATMQHLLGARGSTRSAASEMVRDLRQRGVTGYVDKAGHRWALNRYAEMAVRTTTRQAVVEGAKARMVAQGISIAQVSVHGTLCPICKPWEGRYVSLDGTRSSVGASPVADLAALPGGGPPLHPNCRHTLLPVAETLDAFRKEVAARA